MDETQRPGEQDEARSRAVRFVLITIGTVCVVLGIAGIFLPLLPTTPFLLLAAACYARSSRRFYGWLIGHRILGPPIRAWRTNRTIPRRSKRIAFASVLVMMSLSMLLVPLPWVRYLLAGLTVFLLVMLYRIPTSESVAEALPADSPGSEVDSGLEV